MLVYLSYFFDEFNSLAILVSSQFACAVDYHGQVFGHETFFDSVDNTFFKKFCEIFEEFVVINFSSVHESTSPGKNTGNRVG